MLDLGRESSRHRLTSCLDVRHTNESPAVANVGELVTLESHIVFRDIRVFRSAEWICGRSLRSVKLGYVNRIG